MGMKKNKQRDIGKVLDWNQMMGMRKRAAGSLVPGEKLKTVFKWIVGLIFATYLTYAIFLTILHNQCWNPWMQCRANDCSNVSSSSFSSSSFSSSSLSSSKLAISEPFSRNKTLAEPPRSRTDLKHIVFGIAASARLWDKRKEYIKLWWRRNQMRGYVWVEKPVPSSDSNLPPLKISGNTSHFKYSNKQGHRSAIRLSRIVSETFRMGLPDVHWFVMGDDDTVFVVENLVRVLSKYDHNKFYYIGSLSESHLQNIFFSYGMAYGGGGFAISYPLAKALQGMQDECIQRYPALYGSDDRIQACMSELGVPLTKEPGFHQYDVYGNLFGLLAAHPIAPLVSVHHLDVVEPIFPNMTRVKALQHLNKAINLDSAGVMQQSVCYDKQKEWSISVSWGYAVQIFRTIFSPRELERPSRTFLNWYRRADFTAYAFNTRPVTRHPCQKPFVFYMKNIQFDSGKKHLISNYIKEKVQAPECRWRIPSPGSIELIRVVKKPDPNMWESPRRNCCRVVSSRKKSMQIEVGACREGETISVS
eukprot:TRINITY_DN2883_c0_g1_i4.p1 TRINITY_DN2883_c0_g1~~TRINITY_DN2883_c0_g1_i4.p1  ORF type:complete len:531 (+),score=74.40 TRINITY_DN2883_c0_g1_i4:479-2071(+)